MTENRYFVEGPNVEWEELSFSVNGAKWDNDRPPFPLLQPEKVLSIPLQLRFDDGYTYRLEGTERVDGFDCYVVRFEPIRRDSALYRGTIWIDERTFARIRVKAVQGGLPPPSCPMKRPIVTCSPVTIGNQPIFLFGGLTAQQIVLIAGRNLLVEKDVTFSDFVMNDAAFDSRRTTARSGDRIMFRETDAGLRYYVKQGESRVISKARRRRSRHRHGRLLDPSYAFPLPIVGLNYLNFSVADRRTHSSRCSSAACSPPATSSGRSLVRLSSTRAWTFSRSRSRPATGCTRRRRARVRACDDLAHVDRPQCRVAGDALPEGHSPVSVSLRRHTGTPRRRRPSRLHRARSPTGSAAPGRYRRGGFNVTLQGHVVRAQRLGGVG